MKKPKFDLKKSVYGYNTVFISRILDPYTAHIAKFMYNLGFSANQVTMMSFLFGLCTIAIIYFLYPIYGYTALIVAAILLTLRNIADTVDGKIARGGNMLSSIGGFSDIISDWIIFHAFFFIVVGIVTNHTIIGFLCVTGYMSREFARRKFEKAYGSKASDTEESRKVGGIVSLVKLYDLATGFWLIPLLLLINKLSWIIYTFAVIEYALLIAELGFDYYCLFKKMKSQIKKKSK
jgi:phosphatidylglycerophosphate synthase